MSAPDVLQAIEIIDRKISSLQEARDRLADAFGVGLLPSAAPSRSQSSTSTGEANPPHKLNADPHKKGTKGRKPELALFLLNNGAMSRTEIVNRAGLPAGTVSYCLSDKQFFEQLGNGDWDITELYRHGFNANGAMRFPNGDGVGDDPAQQVLP